MSWKTRELGEFAVTRGGAVDPSSHLSEEFDLYSIPAYDSGVPEIAKGSQIGSSKKVVQPRDVLISRIVPHIRRAWIVGSDNGRRLIASGEWIIFRSEELWPNYLRHFLLSDPFHVQFMQTVSGVGGSLLRARPAEVYKIKIPLPPLAEQKRIAAILDAADELRTKRRESLAQLDTLLQSTFLDLFGDPVTNPKGWDRLAFDDCIDDQTKRAAKIPKSEYSDVGQWQIIDQSQNEVAGYADSDAEFRDSLPAVVFGDHTRCVKLVREPFLLGADGAKVLVPKTVMDPVYLSHLLPMSGIQDLGYSRHMKEVKRLTYPIPPLALQQRFALLVESAEVQKHLYRTQLFELDTLFASLQSRAFRGEL